MTNKLPEAQHYALELADTLGKRAGTSMAASLIRTQHALLERSRESLKHATSFKSKKARDQHADLLAALNQHLDQP